MISTLVPPIRILYQCNAYTTLHFYSVLEMPALHITLLFIIKGSAKTINTRIAYTLGIIMLSYNAEL